ncbi:TPA: type IV secretion system DNA-binding domain-containing protein, partial [Citrobacter freundii]|nr:type IV secretion system DNA-binding domain-containing protein [Citrobacter freundii]
MSLNPRDLTQGGQVAFMRLKMFLQINNLISYYVIMGTVLFGLAVVLMRMSIQNLTNGIIYWFVRFMSPFTERMVSQPVYNIRYYEHTLQYSARQILSDNYTVYCGQLLKQELVIAGCASLLVAFLATLAVYWYLGRTGRQQSEDEIIGGRVLSESPKDVARLLKKRGEASDIRIDDLPLKLDSEIQNFAMHGTVSTGKSTLMRKILKQLRDRGDLVIIYDKG